MNFQTFSTTTQRITKRPTTFPRTKANTLLGFRISINAFTSAFATTQPTPKLVPKMTPKFLATTKKFLTTTTQLPPIAVPLPKAFDNKVDVEKTQDIFINEFSQVRNRYLILILSIFSPKEVSVWTTTRVVFIGETKTSVN